MDTFFTQSTCDRCSGTLEKGRKMSMFNKDCLCMDCIKSEKELGYYSEAVKADQDEIKKRKLQL